MNILFVIRISRETKNSKVSKGLCFISILQHQKDYGVDPGLMPDIHENHPITSFCHWTGDRKYS